MALSVQEARETVDREWGRTLELLTRAQDPDWQRSTRCAGWTVADLAAHAVWGVTMETDALRRARLALPGRADGLEVAPGTDHEAVVSLLDQARDSLVLEVGHLEGRDLDASAPMPYGDVPVRALLDVFAMEAGIHGSDLAAALGVAEGLSPTVVRAAESFLLTFLPLLAQQAGVTPPDAASSFALVGATVRITGRWDDGTLTVGDPEDPVEAASIVSGDDTAVLLFALGRIPVQDPRLEVSGDLELASGFKRYVPGP